MQEATLLFHFIGLGLLVSTMVGGFIINSQYQKAKDLASKALILKTGKPFGFFGPAGTIIMLATGIGNMHAIGAGFLTLGWLSAKIVLFAVASILGAVVGALSRKRGHLVHSMATGQAPAGADSTLASYDRTIGLSHVLLALLMIGILYLSTIGRLGAS